MASNSSSSINKDYDDHDTFRKFRDGLAVEKLEEVYGPGSVSVHYDKFSCSYDKMHDTIGYIGPQVIAETTAKVVKDKNARILDVAAGSGRVGEQLDKLGFTNMDALEPAQGMIQVAASKKIYTNLINGYVLPDKPTEIDDGTYDVVVCSAGFLPGHMTHAMLPEITRMVKPGGIIIFNVSKKYLKMKSFHEKFVCAIQDLLLDGSWTNVNMETKPYLTKTMDEYCVVFTGQTAAIN